MSLKLAPQLIAAAFILGGGAVFSTPVHAYQHNTCACLVTEAAPCSCTKNWKISPLATHTYYGTCDVNGDGKIDVAKVTTGKGTTYSEYAMGFEVKGRDKSTTCGEISETKKDVLTKVTTYLERYVYCVNWSLTKKDSTSTVVTCDKR